MEGGRKSWGGSCFRGMHTLPSFVRVETVLLSGAVVMVGGSSKHGSFTCKGQQRSQQSPSQTRRAAQARSTLTSTPHPVLHASSVLHASPPL